MKWQSGFGLVVQIAVPPFPYVILDKEYSSEGLRILFSEKLNEEERSSLHLNDVLQRKNESGDREYVLQGMEGYALCVTGIGRTVPEARDKAYGLINKIIIPKMFYRTDIGLQFMERDGARLRDWGYM
ncbi:MAG: phosphoribosylamine--glycine ligase [Syntrophorhabdus sp. PtaU1.Bin153]|nr:MAG: phosphoribosylamine--glycine ligase [Syntrophorhabdus sp. PtaU1.Bin153]